MGTERGSPHSPAGGGTIGGSHASTCERLLRAGYEEGRRAYGALPLPFERYSERVVELAWQRIRIDRLPETREQLAACLEETAGADLFLTTACEAGVGGAWEAFTRHCVPRLVGHARRCGAPPPVAEEIAKNIPADVAAPPAKGEARTRIGTYQGAGSLHAWLRVQVARRVADWAKKEASSPITAGLEAAEEVLDPNPSGVDPREILLSRETAGLLEGAVRAAWKDLEEREARALLLRYREHLPLADIGERLGVSVSQASRIVSRAAERLGEGVRRGFVDEVPGSPGERERLWSALRDAVAAQMNASPAASTSPRKARIRHGAE